MNQVLILGAVRPMKRTLSAIKGFEYARDKDSSIKLIVAGDIRDKYAKKVIKYVNNSRHKNAIQMLGRVHSKDKLKLMRESALILVTSVKEGWGLIVTEANSQGTPAIAYDTDGLRDSVINGKTGILIKSDDERGIGKAINDILANVEQYQEFRKAAWQSSKQYTFNNSYSDFLKLSGIHDVD